MKKYPLYSVIIDNIEVGTVGSYDDAKELCGGFDIVFIDEPRPTDVRLLELHDAVENIGYYVKTDSEDFNKTKLCSTLNKIVKNNCSFKDLETKNSDSEDFTEISVWSLKTMLIAAYSEG